MNYQNQELKSILKEYELHYKDILPFISNFSHSTRITEELSKPLEAGRKEIYLYAIEQAKKRKIKKLEENNKGGIK